MKKKIVWLKEFNNNIKPLLNEYEMERCVLEVLRLAHFKLV